MIVFFLVDFADTSSKGASSRLIAEEYFSAVKYEKLAFVYTQNKLQNFQLFILEAAGI